MSPLSTRYTSSASGDGAEAGSGRHRRPESLAEMAGTAPLRPAHQIGGDGPYQPRRAATADGGDAHGRDRNQSRLVAVGDGGGARSRERVTGSHSRPSGARGRATGDRARAARHAAPRAAASRPPVVGSHRAPGTLPIESWLLVGKTRQQVLLASLIAVGLLLVAIPSDRRDAGINAVDAAAQRAAGVQADQKKQPTKEPDRKPGGGVPDAQDQAAAKPTAPASAATTAPSAAPTTKPTRKAVKIGPGNSLRVTGTRAVALTFDDGPDPVQTPKILTMLAEHDIHATFCLVGDQVRKHPEIVRQIVAGGHTLCNHTWNHSLTIGKDKPEEIRADLERTNAAIEAAVPGAAIPYFRAPGGNFTDRLVQVATESGMTSLYWEVDPRDWEHPDGETDEAHVDKIVKGVRENVRPGSIILSHDFNQPDTIAAYEKLLPWLKENFTLGLPAVPVPGSTTTAPAPGPTGTPTANPADS